MSDLQRFVDAQAQDIEIAIRELASGKKLSHWMWYVFPQLKGLGMSEMSQYYGIDSLEEAQAYLLHPVLGSRLFECTRLVMLSPTPSAHELMGSIDAAKLRSCMTLFSEIVANPFEAVLKKYYEGKPDAATLRLLTKDIREAKEPQSED